MKKLIKLNLKYLVVGLMSFFTFLSQTFGNDLIAIDAANDLGRTSQIGDFSGVGGMVPDSYDSTDPIVQAFKKLKLKHVGLEVCKKEEDSLKLL